MLTIFVGKSKQMLQKAKKYHITNELIARFFGYASVEAFNNSSARQKIQKAVELIIEQVEIEIVDKITQED